MLEALVLNPPKGRVKISRAELEALAGWPGSGGVAPNKGKGRRSRMSRRQQSYRAHVRKFLKSGRTMKAAAAAWRKNPWKDDPVGHARAAVRGWKRRGKKARVHPKQWHTRQTKKAHIRGRLPKSLRRYARRGIVRVTRKVAANIVTNPRRRRRSYRRNIVTNIVTNPRRRSISRNPFTDSFKALLNKDVLIEGATVAGGSLAAVALPNLVLNLGPVKNLGFTKYLREGWGSYLVSLLATGAVSGLAAKFVNQKVARGLLIGGIAGTVTRIALDLISKGAQTSPAAAKVAAAVTSPGASGLGGLGLGADVERSVEQAVEAELARQGISDYLVEGDMSGGMGDYLSVAEAENPSLGDPVYSEDGVFDVAM